MAKIVVGGLIEKNGKFLLVQEAKEKGRGKWNIPAGRLTYNETIFEGTKREIFEECGCQVDLTGILEIGNRVSTDDLWIGIIFSTKLINENIVFNKNEILDVKYFTYEEIINMREELRSYDWITNAVRAFVENKISNIDSIKIIK